MPARVSVLAGPARCGKTSALVQRYRTALAEQSADGAVGQTLWISPTQRAADDIRARLVADGTLHGCFSPGIYTFGQFADVILAESEEALYPLGQLLKRQLIERLLAQANAAGRLPHFGPIAETGGLVDLIAGLISDLKRQDVTPERFNDLIETIGPSPKNRELAALYSEYQRLLSDHALYDGDERFWRARELLRKGKFGPFANLMLAVVDGFTDFTHTQQEILELLAQRCSELQKLVVTFPLEQDSLREDLFWKPRETLEQLKKRHPALSIEWQHRRSNGESTAITHLEKRLFCNLRELATLPSSNGGAKVEILGASGQLAEIESLARRIKRLLVLGDEAEGNRAVRPHDIAVVFRSADLQAALVQEVFDEFGIPAAVESKTKLNRSPLLQAMLGVLRLAAEDWPFRQLLAVLSNNYFQPDWAEWQGGTSLAATEWAVRQLQIPRGRKELLSALEWRSKEEAPTEPGDDNAPADDVDVARQQEHRQRYRTAWALLRKLSEALKSIHSARPLAKWTGALHELVSERVVLRVAPGGDEEARKALNAAIGACDQLQRHLKIDSAKFSPQQFVKWLMDVVATEPLPVDKDETGRVRVLSAQSIRALEVPYLFVAGLSEKAFPLPARDDRIYSDAECYELNKAGLRFADHRQRGSEEMLLFYEVITRATRRLMLSYPALDEKAQPLLASPYLLELERCAPGEVEHKKEISLSPVPKHEQPCSPTEQRVQALAELVSGNPQRMAGLLRNAAWGRTSANIIAGLLATSARVDAKFGSFDGLLAGEAAKARLAEQYSPEHCWSVSRLEEYASCPYKFFLRNVVRLEELPELALEIDYGRRGGVAHDVLAMLHRRLNEAGAPRSPVEDGPVKLSGLTDDTIAVLLERIPKGSPLEQALRTIDLRLLAEWMKEYFGQHEKYDAAGDGLDQPLRPAHFEVSFGLTRRGKGTDPLSTEKPFDLPCGEETIRFSGRIDRIDIGMVGDQIVFNVLDYKTGAKKKLGEKELAAGLALQLPIYALAVQELLMIDRRAKPWRVGYWYLKEKGYHADDLPQFFQQTDDGLQESDAWRDLRQSLLARVVTLVRSVRGGMFPVFSLDEQCTAGCEYRTVCRIGQVRSLEKQWSPEAAVATSGAGTNQS